MLSQSQSSSDQRLNMSLLTNLVAALFLVIGLVFEQAVLVSIGLFALSGALTNWLAIYMLFEKVPGLYGSGVIPARFDAFKTAISNMMMDQFFNQQNIDSFLQQSAAPKLNIGGMLNKIDLAPAFDALVDTVAQSSLGSMLQMFGGAEALQPLKQPFIEKMQQSLLDIADSEQFMALLSEELHQGDAMLQLRTKIEQIVAKRLDELTPQMVKEIVQQLIRRHLGWLVVWGGIFGGLIGLISGVIQTL